MSLLHSIFMMYENLLKSFKTHYVLFLPSILFSKSVLPMSHLISFRRHGSATKQWCDYFDLLDTIWNIPDISVYGLKHAKSWLEIYWVSVRVTMLFTLLLGECTFKCSRFVSDVKWMVHLTDQIDFIFRIILINADIFLHMLIIERFSTSSFIPLTSFSKLVIDTWIS